MTTATDTGTYLERVYERLETYDIPMERALHEALVAASNFVADLSTDCDGTSDIPATRREPGECECKIHAHEDRDRAEIVTGITAAIDRCEDARLSMRQKSWMLPHEWRTAGIDYYRGLPITTVDLIETARYVVLRLNWISAGTLRADHADTIRELREGELT